MLLINRLKERLKLSYKAVEYLASVHNKSFEETFKKYSSLRQAFKDDVIIESVLRFKLCSPESWISLLLLPLGILRSLKRYFIRKTAYILYKLEQNY
ncbi:MAG: hypothetical protein DSY42_00940 [Aquifex sp.]|nr:MAG: hypothetical protein DSY42_00940 [Aquifex sp.]